MNKSIEQQYYDTFTELKNLSGKNEKINFVRRHKDDKRFVTMLQFLFDFRITTGLAQKKLKKKINGTYTKDLSDLFEVMEYFKENNTGSDRDILNLKHYLNKVCFDSEMQQFYEEFFTKKLKLGIQVDSVNKGLGRVAIHSFSCQLAHPYAENKTPEKMAVTTKLDGNRMLIEVTLDSNDRYAIRAYTRKGLPIDGLVDVEKDLKDLIINNADLQRALNEGGFVLDGEVLISDNTIPKYDQFQETMKVIRKKGEKKGLTYHVFDIIDYHGFYAGESKDCYMQRRRIINFIQNTIDFLASTYHKKLCLSVVPLLDVTTDIERVFKLAQAAFKNEEEGVMINDCDAKYRTKRTYGLMKVKEFKSGDVLVTGVYQGTGKYLGTLGGLNLLCVLPDGTEFTTNLGSGLSDDDRKDFWNNPDSIINKIVEVQYQGITKNQNGSMGLRFPTFKGVRFDKTSKADINMEI